MSDQAKPVKSPDEEVVNPAPQDGDQGDNTQTTSTQGGAQGASSDPDEIRKLHDSALKSAKAAEEKVRRAREEARQAQQKLTAGEQRADRQASRANLDQAAAKKAEKDADDANWWEEDTKKEYDKAKKAAEDNVLKEGEALKAKDTAAEEAEKARKRADLAAEDLATLRKTIADNEGALGDSARAEKESLGSAASEEKNAETERKAAEALEAEAKAAQSRADELRKPAVKPGEQALALKAAASDETSASAPPPDGGGGAQGSTAKPREQASNREAEAAALDESARKKREAASGARQRQKAHTEAAESDKTDAATEKLKQELIGKQIEELREVESLKAPAVDGLEETASKKVSEANLLHDAFERKAGNSKESKSKYVTARNNYGDRKREAAKQRSKSEILDKTAKESRTLAVERSAAVDPLKQSAQKANTDHAAALASYKSKRQVLNTAKQSAKDNNIGIKRSPMKLRLFKHQRERIAKHLKALCKFTGAPVPEPPEAIAFDDIPDLFKKVNSLGLKLSSIDDILDEHGQLPPLDQSDEELVDDAENISRLLEILKSVGAAGLNVSLNLASAAAVNAVVVLLTQIGSQFMARAMQLDTENLSKEHKKIIMAGLVSGGVLFSILSASWQKFRRTDTKATAVGWMMYLAFLVPLAIATWDEDTIEEIIPNTTRIAWYAPTRDWMQMFLQLPKTEVEMRAVDLDKYDSDITAAFIASFIYMLGAGAGTVNIQMRGLTGQQAADLLQDKKIKLSQAILKIVALVAGLYNGETIEAVTAPSINAAVLVPNGVPKGWNRIKRMTQLKIRPALELPSLQDVGNGKLLLKMTDTFFNDGVNRFVFLLAGNLSYYLAPDKSPADQQVIYYLFLYMLYIPYVLAARVTEPREKKPVKDEEQDPPSATEHVEPVLGDDEWMGDEHVASLMRGLRSELGGDTPVNLVDPSVMEALRVEYDNAGWQAVAEEIRGTAEEIPGTAEEIIKKIGEKSAEERERLRTAHAEAFQHAAQAAVAEVRASMTQEEQSRIWGASYGLIPVSDRSHWGLLFVDRSGDGHPSARLYNSMRMYPLDETVRGALGVLGINPDTLQLGATRQQEAGDSFQCGDFMMAITSNLARDIDRNGAPTQLDQSNVQASRASTQSDIDREDERRQTELRQLESRVRRIEHLSLEELYQLDFDLDVFIGGTPQAIRARIAQNRRAIRARIEEIILLQTEETAGAST